MADDGLGDWRIAAVTTLTKDLPAAYPGGPSHKAGARVLLTTVTQNSRGDFVGFITPSATALALGIAIDAARKAEEAKPKVPYVPGPGPQGTVFSVPAEQSSSLFDFFQHCMVSVTFSYQALETFCNHTISRNLHAPMKIKRRKSEELLGREETERTLSTEEKLKTIVPRLLNVPTPSGKAIWEKFIALRRARDATIHLKSFDQYPLGVTNKETLFFQLLNHDPIEFPETAITLIRYFHKDQELPRWLGAVPRLRN
jgi:hypothetical protein